MGIDMIHKPIVIKSNSTFVVCYHSEMMMMPQAWWVTSLEIPCSHVGLDILAIAFYLRNSTTYTLLG